MPQEPGYARPPRTDPGRWEEGSGPQVKASSQDYFAAVAFAGAGPGRGTGGAR